MLAVIAPDELQGRHGVLRAQRRGRRSQVRESEAALRLQERQTTDQIRQAEASSRRPRRRSKAAAADLENARVTYDAHAATGRSRASHRTQELDQARTAFDAAQAKLDSLEQAGRRAARGRRARAGERRAGGDAPQPGRRPTSTCRPRPPRSAPRPTSACATPRFTRRSTASSTCAPRGRRSRHPGQPIVTLINPDDLWVRADVEETYIDRVRIGDKLTVRLPSGVERGAGLLRGVDASFATQRDVSRTKRDIKTFEVRLRVDNADRRLARRHDRVRPAAGTCDDDAGAI